MVCLFYATLGTICFALVGLWWVVVQFKYDALMSTPQGRTAAYAASMHFVAPGVISLVSVLSTDQLQIWRLGAFIGSVMGIVACVSCLRVAALSHGLLVSEIALLVLFIITAVLSFVTIQFAGQKPIVYEALINVGIITLGVQFAWQIFTAEKSK